MNVSQELTTLLAGLDDLRARNFAGGAALATITRTRGATFRHAGASMLVHGDGSVLCELSGGCPQRDIVQRARAVIDSGHAQLARYDAQHGLDVMMEMGCDGELEVLIEPIHPSAPTGWLDALRTCRQARRPAVLATVFARAGQCTQPGPRRLVWDGDIRYEALDDAALRTPIAEHAAGLDARADTRTLESPEGPVDILFEALLPQHALLLIGTGAGPRALARLGVQMGWHVTVAASDATALARCDLPPAVHRIAAAPRALAARLTLDAATSALVMTHNLQQDIDYLNALRAAPLAYLGALGSRERATRMRAATRLDTDQLHAPAGLDIGSETPQEIAVAVAAELLAHINRRTGGPLHRHDGPIHGNGPWR